MYECKHEGQEHYNYNNKRVGDIKVLSALASKKSLSKQTVMPG